MQNALGFLRVSRALGFPRTSRGERLTIIVHCLILGGRAVVCRDGAVRRLQTRPFYFGSEFDGGVDGGASAAAGWVCAAGVCDPA
jgi:hypothetical protein